jgi:hypothetical protein
MAGLRYCMTACESWSVVGMPLTLHWSKSILNSQLKNKFFEPSAILGRTFQYLPVLPLRSAEAISLRIRCAWRLATVCHVCRINLFPLGTWTISKTGVVLFVGASVKRFWIMGNCFVWLVWTYFHTRHRKIGQIIAVLIRLSEWMLQNWMMKSVHSGFSLTRRL